MNKKILILPVLVGCLLVFMVSTNPNDIPLAFLLVPFFLLAIIIFLSVNFLIRFLKKSHQKTARSMIFSAAITIIAVNFLVLRSVGQLTVQDGLISAAITIILIFYISKFQIKP